METVQSEMSEAIHKATTDHELKMKQLQDKLTVLEKKVKETVEKNKEEEVKLRREKSRVETALNERIELYDKDMRERRETLADLQSKFDTESQEYAILKTHSKSGEKYDVEN